MKIQLVSVSSLLILLSACSNIEVFSKSDSEPYNKKLEGIPFYIKVPAMTQSTKRVKTELLVQIEIISENNGQKLVTRYPEVEPIRFIDSELTHTYVIDLLSNLVKKVSENGYLLSETEQAVSKAIVNLETYKKSIKPSETSDTDVVSNTWELGMVVSPKQYYITNRIPLFGSASSTFKFGPDGTLTEATSSVTDDTAKTLLGLFPINAKLSNRWHITKPADKSAAKSTIEINAKPLQVRTLYTLKKTDLIGSSGDENNQRDISLPPLSLDDAINGINKVQLISKEVQQDSGEKTKKSSKDYTLQGSISPPDTNSNNDAQ